MGQRSKETRSRAPSLTELLKRRKRDDDVLRRELAAIEREIEQLSAKRSAINDALGIGVETISAPPASPSPAVEFERPNVEAEAARRTREIPLRGKCADCGAYANKTEKDECSRCGAYPFEVE